MAWTLTAAQRFGLADDTSDKRYLVTITPAAGVTFGFVDGETNLFGYPSDVIQVPEIGLSMEDVIERQISASEVSIRFAAGALDDLVRAYYVKGKLVTISLGVSDWAEADFIPLWTGRVDKYDVTEAGEIELHCEDGFGYLTRIDIKGGWVQMHPIEILRDMLANSATVNAPGSQLAALPAALWDESSYDHTLHPTISHWNMSRWEAKREVNFTQSTENVPLRRTWIYSRDTNFDTGGLLDKPQKAFGLLLELLFLLNASITLDDQGRIAFRRYDTSRAKARHWTRDMLADFSFAEGNVVNQVNVEFGPAGGTAGMPFGDLPEARTYTADDANSQTDHDGVFSRMLEVPWVRAVSTVFEARADSETTLEIENATLLGFAGARWARGFASASQANNLRLGALRTSAVTVASNVATITIDNPNPHYLEVGDRISTVDLTTNVSDVAIVSVPAANQITIPMTAPDGALADGVGYVEPQQALLDRLNGTTRVAWLLIVANEDDDQIEIVRATAAEALTVGLTPDSTVGPQHNDGDRGPYVYPRVTEYTVDRGQLGTTAIDIPRGALVYDITIPVALAQSTLNRTTHGIAKASFSTPISEVDVQFGDFVSFDHEAVVARGIGTSAGADSSDVWEVIGKTVVDKTHVQWVVAFAYRTAAVEPTVTVTVPVFEGSRQQPAPGPNYSAFFAPTSTRYFAAPYDASMNAASEQLTVSVWINVGSALPDGDVSPIGRWEGSDHEWQLVVTTTGSVRFYKAASSTDTANYEETDGTPISANTWHHVAVTVREDVVQIFVDFTLEASTTTGTIPSTFRGGISQLQIGANGADANVFAGGYVTHAALIAADLTLTGVQWLGAVGLTIPAALHNIPGIRSWWAFNGTRTDAAGDNDLVIDGAGSTPPVWSLEYPPS